MTQDKHTPGPWEMAEPKHPDPRQIEDRLIFANVEGEKLHVAEVYQYQNDNNREANGTALANAQLIVSAPTLQSRIEELEAENIKLSVKSVPDTVFRIMSDENASLEAEKAELVEAYRIVESMLTTYQRKNLVKYEDNKEYKAIKAARAALANANTKPDNEG